MESAVQQIQQASHKLAESMYQQAGAAGGAQPGAGGPGAGPQPGAEAGTPGGSADDEVIDAEYVDVDKES